MLWIVLAVIGGLVVVLVLALATQVDDWSRDLTTNQAATSETATDPLLRPLHTPRSPHEAVQAVNAAVQQMKRWQGSGSQESAGETTLQLVRSSPLWGFKDDVTLVVRPEGTGAVIEAQSQSRVGRGDLGQNPRNIKELFRAVQQHLNEPMAGAAKVAPSDR